MINKIKLALTSKTVWAIIVLFIINGVGAIHNSIPANWLTVIDPIIGLLAIYFKVNPSQNYNSPAVQAMPVK